MRHLSGGFRDLPHTPATTEEASDTAPALVSHPVPAARTMPGTTPAPPKATVNADQPTSTGGAYEIQLLNRHRPPILQATSNPPLGQPRHALRLKCPEMELVSDDPICAETGSREQFGPAVELGSC